MKGISIIIPTYNEERNIGSCLKSIFNQNYPKNKLQVIVADGGSTDRTVEIAKSLGADVLHNKFKVEERGKPYAIKTKANGEIIGLIDADNIIPDEKDWLKRMIKPFDDREIFASDTLYYTYRNYDNLITKYNALIGGDDHIASYFGINDRYCYFTGKWTGMPHQEIDRGEYIEVTFNEDKVPASGSNGFFFRKNIFNKVQNDPFVHPIFIKNLVKKGYKKMAKIKQGLIHVQNGSIKTFFKKKLRRIRRRYNGNIKWDDNYNIEKRDVIKNVMYISTLILPIKDMVLGFYRKPDLSWMFHPFATFSLYFIYGYYIIKGMKY